MAILSRLSDALWSYISPQKPILETKKLPLDTTAAPQRDLRSLSRSQSMSPSSRVRAWQVASTIAPSDSASLVGTRKVKKASPVKRKRTSQPDSSALKKARATPRRYPKIMKSVEVDVDADMDGDTTLLNDYDQMENDTTFVKELSTVTSTLSEIHVDTSPRKRSTPKRRRVSQASWHTDDELDTTFLEGTTPPSASQVDSPVASPSPQTLRQDATNLRSANGLQASPADYALQVQPLIAHLLARGHEAVLDEYGLMVFPFLPESLFCRSGEMPYIRAISGSRNHMLHAFGELLEIASRTRDTIACGINQHPEVRTKKRITDYIKWSMLDAPMNLGQTMPSLVAFTHGDRHTSAAVLQEGIVKEMKSLAHQWRIWMEVLDEFDEDESPIIYGFVISHSLVAVVCGSAAALQEGNDNLQTIGMFDLGQVGYDAWNALAVALVVIHARKVMIGYAERAIDRLGMERWEELTFLPPRPVHDPDL